VSFAGNFDDAAFNDAAFNDATFVMLAPLLPMNIEMVLM
jgi:hypothetical protein